MWHKDGMSPSEASSSAWSQDEKKTSIQAAHESQPPVCNLIVFVIIVSGLCVTAANSLTSQSFPLPRRRSQMPSKSHLSQRSWQFAHGGCIAPGQRALCSRTKGYRGWEHQVLWWGELYLGREVAKGSCRTSTEIHTGSTGGTFRGPQGHKLTLEMRKTEKPKGATYNLKCDDILHLN